MEGVEVIFKKIKDQCNPKNSLNHMLDIILDEKSTNFSGGCGDLMTTHEKMFYMLMPDLIPQVHFGTGKGGYKEYGFKRVTVDFLDEEEGIAYEIDGANHSKELQKLKDRIKEIFLKLEHDIDTLRITNEEVEVLMIQRLSKLDKEGILDVN